MFDVCIVGGGMVGSAIGLGCARLGLNTALIEQQLPAPFAADQPPDMRVSAINIASERLLTELGAWQYITAMRTCPYRRLSVWEKEGCRTDFAAQDLSTSHLGHMIENRLIQLGLHQALAEYDNVEWLVGSKLSTVTQEDQHLLLEDGKEIQAHLLVAADGGQSQLRQMANIGAQGWQYQQQALAIKIDTLSASQDITWQAFSPQGPKAFLPMYGGFASLVWYHNADQIKSLQNLTLSKLKAQIQGHFPAELGDFDILDTASFPLTRMHANSYVKGKLVLAGDAAHCINPLAGQGVNLGFKDVAALLNVLEKAWQTGQPKNLAACLPAYEKARRGDNLLMMSLMDVLYMLFSNKSKPLDLLRNLGLKLADNAGPLKQQAMKYAMGL